MMLLTEREAQSVTTHRDAQTLTPFEVRLTDVKAWAAVLERHVALNVIEDNEVWFSVTAYPATQDQVDGKPGPGGQRQSAFFASRHVEVAYTAHGKLHKLSVYCGVSWTREAPTEVARQTYAAAVLECAENVQQAVRAVSVALSPYAGVLEVRSGASLHLHNIDGAPWSAGPGTSIEMPVTETRCGVCNELLHKANGEWRDERGRTEAMTLAGKHHNGLPKYRRDHVHRPEGEASL